MIPRFFFLLCALGIPALAQDGGQLFTQYCSACHGTDGKGATGGAFPPLAGSPWVEGDPDRAVNVVLFGLHGPVNVAGKVYNLEMPPQGAVLPDDQIAAILTFVRSSWGNQAGPVTPELVKNLRAANRERTTMWTAEEILKLHPLPLEKTALKNLISRVYKGQWTQIPDFTELKAESVEEEHDGVVSLSDSPHKESFGMTWDAQFEAPEAGAYTFILDADDAARVLIDGKPSLVVNGTGPMNGTRANRKKIKLSKGSHPIHIEYLEVKGENGIALGWKGPGAKNWKWLSDQPAPPREPIPIEASQGRPAIYRNFISGTTPRAVGFGFPGGFNLSYSADNLAPELMWTGKFMDGAHHWTERGSGSEPPAGTNVVNLTKNRALPADARFRGYQLDPSGNPTFSIQLGPQILLDSWHAEPNGLVRKLSLTGNGPAIDVLLSDQLPVKLINKHQYGLGDTLLLEAEGVTPEMQNGKTTFKLDPAKPATLTYHWK